MNEFCNAINRREEKLARTYTLDCCIVGYNYNNNDCGIRLIIKNCVRSRCVVYGVKVCFNVLLFNIMISTDKIDNW